MLARTTTTSRNPPTRNHHAAAIPTDVTNHLHRKGVFGFISPQEGAFGSALAPKRVRFSSERANSRHQWGGVWWAATDRYMGLRVYAGIKSHPKGLLAEGHSWGQWAHKCVYGLVRNRHDGFSRLDLSNTTDKLPILKLGEYEMWVIIISNTSEYTTMALWEVRENANKKNNVKARSLLLIALPNEHQLTFSQYTDAKTMFAAIKTRFGGSKDFSTVSPNVNTASPQVSTTSFSDNVVYAFMVENPNGSNLLQQEPFRENFMEDDPGSNGFMKYDKSKVECFNCHKMGYFARECRASRNKEGQFRNQDNSRKQRNNEDTSSKEMLAIDGEGIDMERYAEEQVQTTMALNCVFRLLAATYKRGLATVEEQLITYRKNEVLFSEEVAVLKREVACKYYEINVLKSEFEKVKQEKEGIEFKIEKFDKASKDLDKLLGCEITDKNLEFKSYGSEESKQESNIISDKKSDVSKENSDDSKENSDDSWVKEQVSKDLSSFVESSLNVDKEIVFPADKKVEFVKPKNHEKLVKKSVRPRAVNTARPKAVKTARPNSAVVNVVRADPSQWWLGSPKETNFLIFMWPQQDDTGFVNSGCSRNMTGNITYFSDFKEFDEGYVTFGGGAHGGGTDCLPTAIIFEELAWMGKDTAVTQEETQQDDSVPTPSNDLPLSGKDSMQLSELMLLCTNLQKQVLDLEKAKDAQAKEIADLKKRVQKLERKKKSRTIGFKRLRKVGKSRRVESSKDKDSLGDHEDASKQGRSIKDIDKDADVSLVDDTQGRSDDAEMFDTNDLHGDEVDVDMPVGEKQEQCAKEEEVDKVCWIEAMQDELLQFKLQKVWTLVYLLYGKRAIGTKWVYKNKKDERGIVIRNKARLVAQGYTQEEGIDYDEVFALVARIEAIRLFLAYASFMNFVVYQMDVKSAFLYGKIEEEVYVCQPPGFEDLEFPDRVYKVEKALYGLHQAPRAWYETLSTYLLENGFQRGTIDKTLFIKKVKGDILLVQIYVDDIIFGSTKKELCTEFEKLMHKKFQMSSMGELTFFLGLQVMQKEDGIFISQDKYVDEILKKFGFSTVRIASTPIETSKPLLKNENAKDIDVHLYRSMIGSLM
ncbi:putative ribonuclease H-like domain-containing protein [Tanacetum coccineum]